MHAYRQGSDSGGGAEKRVGAIYMESSRINQSELKFRAEETIFLLITFAVQIGLRTVHWKVGLFPVPGMVRMGVTSPRSYWQPEQSERKRKRGFCPRQKGKNSFFLLLSDQKNLKEKIFWTFLFSGRLLSFWLFPSVSCNNKIRGRDDKGERKKRKAEMEKGGLLLKGSFPI
jgi:hypothetical protein